jgi:uncharacterized membrane protein YkoI
MKKIGMFFVFAFLAFSLVGAAEMGAKDGTGVMHDEVIAAGGQNGTPTLYGEGVGAKTMLRNGEYLNENGQTMRIQGEGDQIRLQVGEHVANCEECNLTQEMIQDRLRIHAQLSNGNQAEIKIMPDQASETALQRLKLNNCGENCSIELKEVGSGEGIKMAYGVTTKTKAKFFGIFNTNVDAEVQIDAETGEILKTKKPWWAVLQTTEAEEVVVAE